MEELCTILAVWVGSIPYLMSRHLGAFLWSLYHSSTCRLYPSDCLSRYLQPEEDFQQKALEPWQEYPFKLKTKYIGPISRIRDIRNQIFEQIHSANDSVKLLLEGSIEHIDNVFAKAADLSHHLQQIDDYLETTNMQTLHTEKMEITRKLAESSNAEVYAQYEEALHTLEERIENHGRLEELRQQIDARLMTIRVSLDNTHAKIIRIRTTEMSNAGLESDDVSKALRDLQIEMDALLSSLDEMAKAANRLPRKELSDIGFSCCAIEQFSDWKGFAVLFCLYCASLLDSYHG